MDELEKRREDLEFKIYWEKRAKKILLICTVICSGLGFIGGIVGGIMSGGGIYNFVMYIVAWGIWAGPGLGGAINIFPRMYYWHKEAKKRGEGDVDATFISNLIIFLVFFFAGPIGLLIRILRINSLIKKYERQLRTLR